MFPFLIDTKNIFEYIFFELISLWSQIKWYYLCRTLCWCMYPIAPVICRNKNNTSCSLMRFLSCIRWSRNCANVPPSAYSISMKSDPSLSKLLKYLQSKNTTYSKKYDFFQKKIPEPALMLVKSKIYIFLFWETNYSIELF